MFESPIITLESYIYRLRRKPAEVKGASNEVHNEGNDKETRL